MSLFAYEYIHIVLIQCKTEAGTPVKIVSTRLIVDRSTGQNKGFGYVELGSPEEVSSFNFFTPRTG